jgi:hypothetical protein
VLESGKLFDHLQWKRLVLLEAKKAGGTMLSFLRNDWPKAPENKSFRPIVLVSIPLILVAA